MGSILGNYGIVNMQKYSAPCFAELCSGTEPFNGFVSFEISTHILTLNCPDGSSFLTSLQVFTYRNSHYSLGVQSERLRT